MSPPSADAERVRLLVHGPAEGRWNMAVDEALLARAETTGVCTLRLYQWAPATLSLGYFQSAGQRASHAPSADCPLVRRASGGGAIVHDRELTYSLVLPAGSRWAKQATALYRLVHQSLADYLRQQGLPARLCVAADDATDRPPPFLCFQRRGEGDLLVGDAKVLGSAQRRRAGAVLQHGSILLARSSAAPELPGLAELGLHAATAAALAEAWLPQLAAALNASFEADELTAAELHAAETIADTTYGTPQWTLRRP